MLIGWATPYNVKSAIGKFSRFIAEELTDRGHDVEIIRIETGDDLEAEALPGDFKIHNAADVDPQVFDRLVVNFGNHSPYHAQLTTLLAKRAPLGIFHDIEMRHFERGMENSHGVILPRLLGGESTLASEDPANLVDEQAAPLLATLASMTCGAVVHGPHYLDTVAAYCPGPVAMIPLSYPDSAGGVPAGNPRAGRTVTLFGMIHEHKQPLRVMEALSRLRERLGPIELHLAGEIHDFYRKELCHEAGRLGISEPVFHGYMADEEMHALLEQSDAICCLRYPVSEGSSASLITALHRGRPLVIPQIASFALVPDDLVYKVSYGHSVDDLADALEDIFRNPKNAKQRAGRARKWAADRFSAQRYADELEPLLSSMGAAEELVTLARRMVPAITAPDGEPVPSAIPDVAAVMDWMMACQR